MRKPTELVYTANCGFIVSTPSVNCIFDSLFTAPDNSDYPGPSKRFVSALLSSEKPFDKPNVLLITHAHWDHFDAELTRAFLSSQSSNVVVCPLGAYEQIVDEATDANRVVLVTTDLGDFVSHDLPGVTVEAARTLHCGPPGSPRNDIENTVYIARLGGRTVLHAGDLHASPDAASILSRNRERMDVAILPLWFLDQNGLQIIRTQLNTKRIAVSHVPSNEHQAIREAIENATIAEREILGDPFLPDREGQSIQI